MDLLLVSRFLDTLWEGKSDRGWILIWLLENKRSLWFKTPTDAAAGLSALKNAKNAYVGCALSQHQLSAVRRVKAGDVCGVPGFWADIDYGTDGHSGKKKIPPTREDAMALVAKLPLRPTMLIHSGHGLQAWWLFKEVLYFTNAQERDEFKAQSKAWADVVLAVAKTMGWEVDAVWDLARVLRVGGTMNCKHEPHVPVEIIWDDGPRYNDAEAFTQFGMVNAAAPPAQAEKAALPEPAVAPASPVGVDGLDAKVDTNSPIVFVLKADANPPTERLQKIIEVDQKFRKTWKRDRTDFKDQSGSSYCISLAVRLMHAHWSTQEIVDAVVAWRRKESEDLKLDRFDWYRDHVIGAARRVVGKDEALEFLTNESVEPPTPEDPVAAKEQKTRIRSEILSALGRVMGNANLKAVIQVTRDSPVYSFEFEGAAPVTIGSASDLLSLGSVRAAVMGTAGYVINEEIGAKDWIRIVRTKVMRILELVDEDAAKPSSIFIEALMDYLRSSVIYRDDEQGVQSAIKSGTPFIREGRLHIFARALKLWISQNDKALGGMSIWSCFRSSGFDRTAVYISGKKGPSTRSAYSIPVDRLPEVQHLFEAEG